MAATCSGATPKVVSFASRDAPSCTRARIPAASSFCAALCSSVTPFDDTSTGSQSAHTKVTTKANTKNAQPAAPAARAITKIW
eukprot:scaffold59325_cov69-Phaeocystis_antarctica.AAC.1